MEQYCSEENSFDIELVNGYVSVDVEYKCDEDVLTPLVGTLFMCFIRSGEVVPSKWRWMTKERGLANISRRS